MAKQSSGNLYTTLKCDWSEPRRAFLQTAGRSQPSRTITYGELDARTGQFANALVQMGVRAGDRVAMQVEKSPEAILVYLACLRCQAIFVPLNTAYTISELDDFLADARPAATIVSPESADDVTALTAKHGLRAPTTLSAQETGTLVDVANASPADFEDVPCAGDDIAAILYTSGTTGRSKGAMLTHDNLASNAKALTQAWRFTADDTLLHALPVYHAHGLFVAMNVTLTAASTVLFLPHFDIDEVFDTLPNATTMMGVPTFYTRMLQDERLTKDATQHVRLFVSGSAPLLAQTHREFTTRTGHKILERYGMTETGMNTSNPYDGTRLPGSVGPPLPGVEVRITHPDSAEVLEKNEIGMIEVRGPNVFNGYWRQPEKTKSEFRNDGFFITGDLGKIDNSSYVHIVGRAKDLVITGGFNVYPKEVEAQIDAIGGVLESAVIGLPHPDFGEGLTAIIVLITGTQTSEADIKTQLRTSLANYKIPKRIVFVDELPRNTMGKVQKNTLRTIYQALYA